MGVALGAGDDAVLDGRFPFPFRTFARREDYLRSEAALGGDVRHVAELALAERLVARACVSGFCWLCGAPADFAFRPAPAGEAPDWREQLECGGCGLIARSRLGLLLALAHLDGRDDPAPFITEQVSRAYRLLKSRFPRAIGSEYVQGGMQRLRLDARVKWHARSLDESVRHEDVTALTLPDGSADAVVCFEVLEHVPRYRDALAGFRRVLRPGGVLVLSVPFLAANAHTVVRAELADDGTVRHLESPEYHADPASPEGCLAFYNFGWSLLDDIRAAGFAATGLVDAWSPASGFMGSLGVIVARR